MSVGLASCVVSPPGMRRRQFLRWRKEELARQEAEREAQRERFARMSPEQQLRHERSILRLLTAIAPTLEPHFQTEIVERVKRLDELEIQLAKRKRRESADRRRAALLGADGVGITPLQRAAIMRATGGQCAYCPAPAQAIDHVVPLSRGGRHEPGNAVAACMACNSSKGAKLLTEWSGGATMDADLRARLEKYTRDFFA